jgi:hypothetical protein
LNKHSVESNAPNVLTVRFPNVKKGWEQWILLSADRHHDSIHCNRKLEKYHLEQAKDRGALIIDAGDLFCAMQGKYDPRSSMDDLRPEDKVTNYLDSIVRHAADFYGPYAKNFLMLGKGNHESNISKRHGTDLISNLAHDLNSQYGGSVYPGGYGGWVRFMFTIQKTKRKSLNLKYYHGAGGGGPVTRGVIQTNRMAVYLPDADIVFTGHTHDSWHVPIARERLSNKGVVKRDVQHHVRAPGYKDEYADGSGGWAVETWKPPKSLGSVWVKFYYKDEGVEVDITQAVT